MKVVLTRERGANASLVAQLPAGYDVSEVPLTRSALYDVEVVRAALDAHRAVGPFRTLVVTSARGAPYAALAQGALSDDAVVCCVGPVTERALSECGVGVDVVGRGAVASLATVVSAGPVLVLGAKRTRPELAASLRARGLDVFNLACYETVPVELTPDQIEVLARADVVFIGAPSAWAVAQRVVSPRTWVVVPGATTAAAVRATHSRVAEGWGAAAAPLLATLGFLPSPGAAPPVG